MYKKIYEAIAPTFGWLLYYLITTAGVVVALNVISEQTGFGWHIPHNFSTYSAVLGLRIAFGVLPGFNSKEDDKS